MKWKNLSRVQISRPRAGRLPKADSKFSVGPWGCVVEGGSVRQEAGPTELYSTNICLTCSGGEVSLKNKR